MFLRRRLALRRKALTLLNPAFMSRNRVDTLSLGLLEGPDFMDEGGARVVCAEARKGAALVGVQEPILPRQG